jgi:chromosomal replication initiation ATPase DnaA
MSAARQLPLEFPFRAALGREDFLVGAANVAAVAAIDGWPDWPYGGLLLIGPTGSGKSHLVEVWRRRSDARRYAAAALPENVVDGLDGISAVAVEDCGPGVDEPALFHLINVAERRGVDVLLTARSAPGLWPVTSPDLLSRLRRLPTVAMEPPDEDLLAALIVKLFADRQIAIERGLVDYALPRLERSFEAVQSFVDQADRVAMAEGKPVTRALAARVLAAGRPLPVTGAPPGEPAAD